MRKRQAAGALTCLALAIMTMMALMVTQTGATGVTGVERGTYWSGYWQGWANEDEDVTWWEDDIPGNCAPGCVISKGFFAKGGSYNSLTYCFTTLLNVPKPDQNDCSKKNCPIWDGKGIYNEKDTAITPSSTIDRVSPSVVAIGDFCRYARKFPGGPKRCIIGLGGWSDWARIGNADNAKKLAKLIGKLVLFTFADGIDLDFEHLAEYTKVYGEGEIAAYAALVNAIRDEFNAITADVWTSTLNKRIANLKKHSGSWYKANVAYLGEVAKNGLPHLEIQYTTRFNAFLNPADPWDYLDPNSTHPASFITDDEGKKLWPQCGKSFDTVNIMTYDQDKGMKLNFGKIAYNFHTYGKVPQTAINIGFEPGEQGGGGDWEGEERDLKAVDWMNTNKYGGAMIWSVNPDKGDTPTSYKITPAFVKKISDKLNYPKWAWGKAPIYAPMELED